MDHGIQELQELTGSKGTDRGELVRLYKGHYSRGWRASQHAPGDSIEAKGGPSVLERADVRKETNAWYEGYEDYAVGLEKWSTPGDKGLF